MVFTKVNIGHSTTQAWRAPLGGPAPGPLLLSQLTLVLNRHLKARHQQASAKVAEDYQSPASFLLSAVLRYALGTPALTLGLGSVMGQILSLQGPRMSI